jgi:hypothetical protein
LKTSEFFQNTPYSKDDLIITLDKSKNNTSKLECKKHTIIIEDVLMDSLSSLENEKHKKRNKIILSGQPLPDEYRYGWEVLTNDEKNKARIAIYKERDEIADLCQENRKITENYGKCKDKILNQIETSQKLHESEIVPCEKMPPRIRKMYDDKIITGEKINGRWVVRIDKRGIKEIEDWAVKMKNNRSPRSI